jgi:hypothetical protein
MSVSNKIFVIKNKDDGIIAFYSDLEKAKDELKKIYNKTIDFKHYYYEINIYHLVENEYIITNESYKYNFDNFSTKDGI